MNKYEVHISFIVRANTRHEVYGIVGDISHRHLRDMATIERVSLNPLKDPDEWIAINEPVRNQRVKVERVAETGEVTISPLDS